MSYAVLENVITTDIYISSRFLSGTHHHIFLFYVTRTKEYMGSADGTFSFAFILQDANGNLLDQDSEAPFGTVYAQIDFTGPSNLKMVLCNCVARPSEDNSAGIEHYLIKYG